MKHKALFSSKDKSKTSKCCLLQVLFGPLTVKREEFDQLVGFWHPERYKIFDMQGNEHVGSEIHILSNSKKRAQIYRAIYFIKLREC